MEIAYLEEVTHYTSSTNEFSGYFDSDSEESSLEE